MYFIFLLILILVDIPTLIIDYHYGTVMFHVSWCRFMIVLFGLSLALLITLYVYSLTEYFIILTPLYFVYGLQVEDTGKRMCLELVTAP